jgi:hypothetical protein
LFHHISINNYQLNFWIIYAQISNDKENRFLLRALEDCILILDQMHGHISDQEIVLLAYS